MLAPPAAAQPKHFPAGRCVNHLDQRDAGVQ